jgi:hypothetical protein
MSYSVKSIEVFEKQAKRLIRKYASLKVELLTLVGQLKEEPEKGTTGRLATGSRRHTPICVFL